MRGKTHGDQPAVDRRHHLHSLARRVRVSGRCAGRILAVRDRLGAGTNVGGQLGRCGVAHGADRAQTVARSGASLRSWRAVHFVDYTEVLKRHQATISMSRKGTRTTTLIANLS